MRKLREESKLDIEQRIAKFLAQSSNLDARGDEAASEEFFTRALTLYRELQMRQGDIEIEAELSFPNPSLYSDQTNDDSFLMNGTFMTLRNVH